MKFSPSKFARYLVRQSKANGLSNRQAAAQIGISAATYNRLVNEKFLPDINTYAACCLWLDCEMGHFFTR